LSSTNFVSDIFRYGEYYMKYNGTTVSDLRSVMYMWLNLKSLSSGLRQRAVMR